MSERRADPRASGARVRAIAARVRAGHDVLIVDMSASGALLEGARPLRPGALVDVQFAANGRRVVVTARVVRCLVAALDADEGIRYQAALCFEDRLEWFCEHDTTIVSARAGPACVPRR